MKFLCRAYTTGGPIGIMRRSDVLAWDGGEHYFTAINATNGKLAHIMYITDFKYPVTVLFQENENFHVFYDKFAFAVISEDYAEPGHEVRIRQPAFANANRLYDLEILCNFGGKVVIFDAVVSGQTISLQKIGSEITTSPDGLPRMYCDAALVDVSVGDWQISVLDYKDDFLGYHGLLFRLLHPPQ